jgi:hypothetical protein
LKWRISTLIDNSNYSIELMTDQIDLLKDYSPFE